MKIRYVSDTIFLSTTSHAINSSRDGCGVVMKSSKFEENFPTVVPILPLRDMVVFPNVMVPLFLKGSRVVKLAESVVDGENLVGLFYQKSRNRLNPLREEISMVGTLARIQQVVRLDSGGVKAIADGICRVRLMKQIQYDPYLMGEVDLIEEQCEPQELLESLVRSVGALFKLSLSLGRPVSDHAMSMIERAEDPGRLADLIAVYLPLQADIKQSILEIEDPLGRLKSAFSFLQADVHALQPRLQAANDTVSNTAYAKRQKEMRIRQQMRAGKPSAKPLYATLEDGYVMDLIVEAVLESNRKKAWVRI